MTPAQTKGPWKAVSPKGRPGAHTSIVEGADGRMVLFAGAPFRSDEEIAANGLLGAAAIDLRDGCSGMLGLVQLLLGRDDLPDEVRLVLQTNHRIEAARAAIAKAEPQTARKEAGL